MTKPLTAKARKRLEWHAEHMKRLISWPWEWRDEFEERASIMQHGGEMDQVDAESRAFLHVLEMKRQAEGA